MSTLHASRARFWLALQAALLLGAAGWVYAPGLRGGWLWDDNTDITANALIRDPAALRRIWFAPQSLDYYPLKASVQWLQWRWWGDQTLGYHLTNLALHVLGALLFWRVLRRLGVAQAWFGGLLFAVHPLAVESVAWIAELKNTLSLPPLLLAFLAYLNFDETSARAAAVGTPRRRKGLWLTLALVWFLVALLCKSAVVMFPAALLLYAWWKRGRIGARDLAASAPFFALSLALGLVTVGLQRAHLAGADMTSLGGPASRLAGAGLLAGFYLFKSVVPLDLMPIYPRWQLDPPSLLQWLPLIGWAFFFAGCWIRRERGGRHAAFGLGWFVLHLVPVLGLVAISYQRFSWVMDHLAYVSLLGVLALAAAGLSAGAARLGSPARTGLVVAALGLAGLLAVESHGEVGHYRNSEALWTFAVERNPNAWLAHFNLGVAVGDAGRPDQAMTEYETALRLRPDYAEAHNNLASLLLARGRTAEAIAHAAEAVRLQPTFVNAHTLLGNALENSGRAAEAAGQFADAARLAPQFPDARVGLCDTLLALGRTADAIAQGREAVRLAPDAAEPHNSLGRALRAAGRPDEAAGEYRRAAELAPSDAAIRANLATALAVAGRMPEAIAEFRTAVRLQPGRAQTHNNLGLALARSRQWSAAIAEYREALRLDPQLYEAHLNLGQALGAIGQADEAQRELARAAQLRPP